MTDRRLIFTTTNVRRFITLMKCCVCNRLLQNPVTLPCGRAICHACLPERHIRQNISWPGTAAREEGIRCPVAKCSGEHALEDCSRDTVLGCALAAAVSVLEAASRLPVCRDMATAIMDRRHSPIPTRLLGSMLLAAYTLAKSARVTSDADIWIRADPPGEVEATKHATFDMALLTRLELAAREELHCRICLDSSMRLPVTTACGHTFCQLCLYQSLREAMVCPLCRRSLSVQLSAVFDALPRRPVTFPEYIQHQGITSQAGRKSSMEAEVERLRNALTEARPMMGWNVNVFPKMPAALEMSTSRWPVVDRALQGDKIFGMSIAVESGRRTIGTLVRIVSVSDGESGRVMLRVECLSRFQVVRQWLASDCVMAQIRPLDDISIADEEAKEARETAGHQGFVSGAVTRENIARIPTAELADIAMDVIYGLTGDNPAWLDRRILNAYGYCPRDPVTLPWWLVSVMPVSVTQKARMLATTSVRERLKICWEWLFDLGIVSGN
jgi:hypothetical protein